MIDYNNSQAFGLKLGRTSISGGILVRILLGSLAPPTTASPTSISPVRTTSQEIPPLSHMASTISFGPGATGAPSPALARLRRSRRASGTQGTVLLCANTTASLPRRISTNATRERPPMPMPIDQSVSRPKTLAPREIGGERDRDRWRGRRAHLGTDQGVQVFGGCGNLDVSPAVPHRDPAETVEDAIQGERADQGDLPARLGLVRVGSLPARLATAPKVAVLFALRAPHAQALDEGRAFHRDGVVAHRPRHVDPDDLHSLVE